VAQSRPARRCDPHVAAVGADGAATLARDRDDAALAIVDALEQPGLREALDV